MSQRVALPTPFQQFQRHAARWKSCTLCDLHKDRCRVVLARGSVPCDVLFIGEAPGQSEDVLGVPFVGPAGKLLDSIVEEVLEGPPKGPNVRVAFTNTVACIPKYDGDKGEPEYAEIQACKPRLEEFIRIASPRLIVAVGSVARKALEQGYKASPKFPPSVQAVIDVIHPAAILRAPWVQRRLMEQRAAVQIRKAVGGLT